MKRRLYFLLPNLASARTVHNELLLAKVEERNMHVVAREGSDMGDLPEASITQKSDIVHGAQLGFIVGGFTGVGLGILASAMNLLAPGLEVWSLSSIAIGGAFLGSLTSSMVAVSIPSTRLKPFRSAIDQGKYLFMVDIPVQRVEELSHALKQHHPEVDMRNTEPTIPAFP